MEETANVTTSGEVEATSQDVATESTVTDEVTTSEEVANIDTAETVSDSTETNDETETNATTNWENSYKELQGAFTRQGQELAELKKQIAQNQPKYVDDKGKITPEYRENYQRDIDTREYYTYLNAASRLEPEQRNIVEDLLREADRVYNPNNKRDYEQIMNQVENYFDSSFVKKITLDKQQLENNMQSEFDRLQQEYKTQKSQEIAELVEQSEDLKALLYQDSENYSPEVFGIVRQMFNLTGGVDLDVINKAVSSIKALGVKEHLAQQKAQAEKQKATVPTGQAVTVNNQVLTKDYAMANYQEAVKKFGMDKVDEIIMKG